MTEKILENILKKYPCRLERDCKMAPYTTFKIGGSADFVLFPEDTDIFCGLISELAENSIRFTIVGNGSNLLFPDDGYRGVVIVTTGMKKTVANGNKIIAECGASLIRVANTALENSLTGFEFAYGIPGSVGGAVYMNAGAYSGEISQILESCTCFDTVKRESIVFDSIGCDFSYRNSVFEKNGSRYVILEATFKLEHGDKTQIRAQMDDYMSRRREKQPLEYPSAGSAFKRAPGYFTAKLIDDAGLKGYRIGGAQVSTKHAGFIINVGGATADDVKELMEHIKKTVKEKFGVEIEGEIRTVE